MRTFGLIGFPLSHSFSQKYFTEKFKREHITDCEFENFSIENISDFSDLIKSNSTIFGLSVTIPHKQSVMKFLDALDSKAWQVGAVNCIKVSENNGNKGYLTGFNTDVFGFEKSLIPLLKSHHTHALILGTGGASKAVAYILDESKIKFSYVSRLMNPNKLSPKTISYSDLNAQIISESSLIINATPLGMFPDISSCPDIPYELLTSKHLLYDLNYNPEETLFLKKGKAKGAKIKNGLEMLHLQAEEAWKIWNS